MKRLIAKELLELRWYVAAILGIVLAIVLNGDPIAYRTAFSPPLSWIAPMAVAFVMGLSGYSRETADGTLDFTFSRPISWWWILPAKFLAGSIAMAGVAIVALPVSS